MLFFEITEIRWFAVATVPLLAFDLETYVARLTLFKSKSCYSGSELSAFKVILLNASSRSKSSDERDALLLSLDLSTCALF